MALKFTVHGVQSFIKGHRKSGVISTKHSRDIIITNRISPLRGVRFLPVTATYAHEWHENLCLEDYLEARLILQYESFITQLKVGVITKAK